MKQSRRRLWTWTISTVAGLIVLAAVVTGLFRGAVLLLPGYRDDLERKIGEITGYDIRIGEMNLYWRGLSPVLDLDRLVVMSAADPEQPAVRIGEMVIGTSLWRLLHGDVTPRYLSLTGLQLAVERQPDGHWIVSGLESRGSGGVEVQKLLDELARFKRVRLAGCVVEVSNEQWFGQSPRGFELREADLQIGETASDLLLRMQMPADIGRDLQVQLHLDGPLNRPAQWQFDAEASAGDLQLGDVLRPWIKDGAGLAVGAPVLSFSGSTSQRGGFDQLSAALDLESLETRSADGSGAELSDIHLEGQWQRGPETWGLDLQSLRLRGPNGPWPVTRGRLSRSVNGAQTEWRADLGFVRLDDLAPLFAVLHKDRGADRLAGLRGDLRSLVMNLSLGDGAPRYRYRAEVAAAGVDDGERRFVGLTGGLSGDDSGGRLQLQPAPAEFAWPSLFADPITIDSLSGRLDWTQTADGGWRIGLDGLSWQLMTAAGAGEGELLLPGASAGKRATPRLKLRTSLQTDDVVPMKSLVPIAWHASLRDWLDRAIRGGRVVDGELRLDLPFSDIGQKRVPEGFQLDLQVAGGQLAFLPDWPTADGLEATLAFRGNGLNVKSDRGSLRGLKLEELSARIEDFSERRLVIDGRISGDAARFYQVLDSTPLRERLSALLDKTDAAGPTVVGLGLQVPLDAGAEPEVAGTIDINEGRMRVTGLPEDITGIQGQVRFDNAGVSAQDLHGRWMDIELSAALAPAEPGVTDLSVEFDLSAESVLLERVPPWIRSRIRGRSHWSGGTRLGVEQTQPFVLRSGLEGTTIELPEPLYRPAGESGPLTISLSPDDSEGVLFEAQLAELLSVRGRVAAVREDPGFDLLSATLAQSKNRLDYLQIWFGGAPPQTPEPGIFVGGRVDSVDVRGWGQIYEPGDGDMPIPDPRLDVAVAAIRFGSFRVRDAQVRALHDDEGWALQFDSEQASGSLNYPSDQQGVMTARFDHLVVTSTPDEGTESDDEARVDEAPTPDFTRDHEPLDPTTIPTFDVDVAALTFNRISLGHVVLQTSRLPEGQKVDRFSSDAPVLQAQVQGQWTRAGDTSQAGLGFDIKSSQIADALTAFGYAANLEARQANIKGQLSWDSAGEGLSLAQARGTVSLQAERGRMRTVEPGAGRVLGLFSFYALPRRLTLNFGDVVGKGLAFDRIDGNFDLGDGVAHTSDLDIEAPSVRIEMRGDIGLAARDYDQRVTLFPDVSGGVTLGAALLGGPAAAVIALLAQELLDKPLDQASQLSYRLTGSWDNPQVNRIDGGE